MAGFHINFGEGYDILSNQAQALRDNNDDVDLWTACISDIVMGETDMCIGDMWNTPERSKLTAFTHFWWDDQIRA